MVISVGDNMRACRERRLEFAYCYRLFAERRAIRFDVASHVDLGETCQTTLVENALVPLLLAVEIARRSDFVAIANLRGDDIALGLAGMPESSLAHLGPTTRDRDCSFCAFILASRTFLKIAVIVEKGEADIEKEREKELVEKSCRLFERLSAACSIPIGGSNPAMNPASSSP